MREFLSSSMDDDDYDPEEDDEDDNDDDRKAIDFEKLVEEMDRIFDPRGKSSSRRKKKKAATSQALLLTIRTALLTIFIGKMTTLWTPYEVLGVSAGRRDTIRKAHLELVRRFSPDSDRMPSSGSARATNWSRMKNCGWALSFLTGMHPATHLSCLSATRPGMRKAKTDGL